MEMKKKDRKTIVVTPRKMVIIFIILLLLGLGLFLFINSLKVKIEPSSELNGSNLLFEQQENYFFKYP